MHRKHPKHRRESEVPVSAFSDIAFLLIIFFILATTLVQISGVVTEIPSGEQAKNQQEEDETPTVRLNGDLVLLNEKRIDMPQLRRRLAEMKLDQKTGDAKVVLLEAAGDVTYQTYFDVMSSISAAGGVTAILQEE
jgi:biopolymer transport protein ExbD